jgi:hypothetical protein
MKASPKSPSYLVRNPYSYCFRMVVPKDLQKFVGKRELPRNRTIKLTISGLNRSATDVITTTDGSATCITTMQLK